VLPDDLNFPVDMEHVHHLAVELGIPTFQVVTHLVRAQLAAIQDFGDGSASKLSETRMPLSPAMLAGMSSQKVSRPQLVGVTQRLGLLAGQGKQPGPCLRGDLRWTS
jgi:hypothetical protein